MKRVLKLIATLGAVLAFGGCDDGNISNATVSDNLSRNIAMVTNKPYVIKKGDVIEKISKNPELKMNSNLETGETTVTLLSGYASIIKK